MWTTKYCFVGDECWCGIIVNPQGQACNEYGSISMNNCKYIANAMNGVERGEPDHALPWTVEEFDGRKAIVTVESFGTDSLEGAISIGGSIFRDLDEMFVDAVNY